MTEGEQDEASTQPASVIPTWVDAAVDEDVVAALQFDLEGGASRCQFRTGTLLWIRLSGTATILCPQWWTVQEWKCSPCQLTQPWQPRHRRSRRLVLIPQFGSLGSTQDRQSDEFQGRTGGPFRQCPNDVRDPGASRA